MHRKNDYVIHIDDIKLHSATVIDLNTIYWFNQISYNNNSQQFPYKINNKSTILISHELSIIYLIKHTSIKYVE
jgi:hypothetical protein